MSYTPYRPPQPTPPPEHEGTNPRDKPLPDLPAEAGSDRIENWLRDLPEPNLQPLPPRDFPQRKPLQPPQAQPATTNPQQSSRDFIDPRSTRPTGPATTFDHITAKLDLPPPPLEREPSLIKRAATATRQVLVGRTPSEKARKAAQDAAKAREEREKAERDEFVRGHRRELAIRGELTYDELYDLAVLEHVYLTPRRNRFDHDDYALADGVVARVSGRDENGEFVFLGSDKRLFLSRHDLGRGARPITAEQERHSHHYSHARGVAIAYYKLTF